MMNITVRDANNCSAYGTISQDANSLSAYISTDSIDYQLCEGEELNLKANISGDPGFQMSGYNWSTGATTQQIVVSEAGIYNVTVTTTNGCTRVAQQQIQAPLPLPQPVAVGQEFLCPSKSAVLDVLGGPFVIYVWTGGLPTIKSPTITAAGSYTVTVKDAKGCLNSSTVTVKAGVTPPIAIDGSNKICTTPAQTRTLSVSGANNLVDYKWTTKETTPEITINEPGAYGVTVTNDQTCTGTASILMQLANVTNVTVVGTNIMCVGDSATLRVAQNFESYVWGDGSTERTLQIKEPGVYYVTVTNQTGCTGITNYTVQPRLVNMTLSNTPPICPGDTATLRVSGTALASYLWSTGQTASNIRVTKPGQYNVTVVDNTGCGGAGKFTVASKFVDTARIKPLPYLCDGSIRLAIRPDSLSQFVWNTGDSTAQITVNQSGRYSFSLTSKDGCRSTDSLLVSVPSAPNVQIEKAGALCENTAQPVTLAATPGYKRYLWSNGDTLPNSSSDRAGLYTVQVWDNVGCSASASVQVGVSTLPQPVAAVAPYACDGTRTLRVNADYTSYQWSSGSNTPDATVSAEGEYRVTVSNADGCTQTAVLDVTIPAQPQVALSGGAAFCPGSSTLLEASLGFASYAWSDGTSTSNLTVNQPGTYEVVATDANGCTSVAQRLVEQLPMQPVIIRGATSICTGRVSVFTLQGGPWNSYAWSTGEASPAITVSQAGTYGITATNDFGCSGVASIQLTVNDTLTPVVSELPYQCNGQIALDAGSGYANYLWSSGAASRTIQVSQSGNYVVTVSDFSGCSGSKMVSIAVPEVLELTATAPESFCAGQSVTASATEGFAQYIWQDGVSTSARSIAVGGTYALVATDAYGCTKTAEIFVNELPTPSASIVGPALLCTGSSQFLYVDSPTARSYAWSDGTTLPFANISAGGTYGVTVSDANGCTTSATFAVQESKAIPATVIQQNRCNGLVRLTAESGYANYNWSFGGDTPEVEVNIGGEYEVVVSNTDGCTAATTISVTIPAPPVAAIEATGVSVCDAAPATLSTTPGMSAYAWSNGASASSTTATENGSYRVTVTDADGCTAEAEITLQLTDDQAPTIACPADQKRCFSDALVTYNTPTISDNCSNLVLTQTTGLPSGESYPMGTTQNRWVVQDAQGNTAECSFQIEVLPGATLTLVSSGNDQNGGNQGYLDVTVEGGNPPYSFEWSLNNVLFATTEDLQNIGQGTYTLVVRDANNCEVAQETYPVSNTSSTSTPLYDDRISLMPNPVRGNFVLLQLEQLPATEFDLQLYDATGRIVRQMYSLRQQQVQIDLDGLPTGTYSLNYRSAGQVQSFKVVKVVD